MRFLIKHIQSENTIKLEFTEQDRHAENLLVT